MEREKSYRESLARIREIVDEIESGELDLDVLSERVREASELLRYCRDHLTATDEQLKQTLAEL
jgi:exodeoxyribonuclease VII small subunit